MFQPSSKRLLIPSSHLEYVRRLTKPQICCSFNYFNMVSKKRQKIRFFYFSYLMNGNPLTTTLSLFGTKETSEFPF